MKEEIFGPLLPVIKFKELNEVIEFVQSQGEKPLTMYIFSDNRARVDKIIESIPSGSVVVNDVLFQFANHHIPFGGVGNSGEILIKTIIMIIILNKFLLCLLK